VTTIPWGQSEVATYLLKDKDGRIVGTASLRIQRSGATTTLSQHFRDNGNRDEIDVVVESDTLKPISSTRLITRPDGRDELAVTYTEEGALIRQGGRQSGISVPEHAYDNDTSLFLWRTVPFEEGYQARYVTVITNRRNRQTVEITVRGRERVEVAAGTFNAWRVEIRTANARQVAWYADTASRTLLRYDNGIGMVFELDAPLTAETR
jgi:hypothetical protein